MSWLQTLASLTEKPSRCVAGVLSGTSVDSVSVALCRISGTGSAISVSLLSLYDHPYPPALRARVTATHDRSLREFAELHVELGELFARAVIAAVDGFGLALADLDLIGSHGQTVYHHSGVKGALRATLQLGDGDVVAARTGRAVISDFRARDIAGGGEGAPLTPFSDYALFKPAQGVTRIVVNLGGIANITILDPTIAKVRGFDTGPANAPLDRVVRMLSAGAQSFDADGAVARSGSVNRVLLQKLLDNDPFIMRVPPKSTGFESYGDQFVERVVAEHGKVDCDLLATLTEFVAETLVRNIHTFVARDLAKVELILAGGGARNVFLRERIAARAAPARVTLSDACGVPVGAREAMGFAVLAHEALMGRATALPGITGIKQPAVLGKLSFPSCSPCD